MIEKLESIETREVMPGYHGKFIHSSNNTFAYWEVKANSPLPEHSHHHEQVVHMLDGIFVLTVEGEENELHAGDVYIIPSNAKHSGISKTDCIILDVFSPVREDYK